MKESAKAGSDDSPSELKPVRIGFVLLSNSHKPIPSTRIAVLNMFPFLRAQGFDPYIVFEPIEPTETPDLTGVESRIMAEGFQIVVFQKVHGPSVEDFARKLGAAGIKTVYSVCDLVVPRMTELTDVTVVVTDYLKSLHPVTHRSRVHVVHDGIENPDWRKTEWNSHRGSRARPLRAVLVTSSALDHLPIIGTPPDWLQVTIVGRYPVAWKNRERFRQARWMMAGQPDWRARLAYLKFLADRRIRCVAWDPNGVYEALRQADIGVIPIDRSADDEPGIPAPSWKVKSENRLTMKMGVGLPVIATPIPAYEPVIEQGKNGFLARSARDWEEQLEWLRDPGCRRSMGERARDSVLNAYSMEAQAERLLKILTELTQGEIGRPIGRIA